MVLTLVALLSLFTLWALATRGTLRRTWRGEETRHFEREWEIKGDKDRVYFSIPSFKSAYFEMRPANWLSRLLAKSSLFAPTTIDKRFRFLTEEPHLALVLSQKLAALDALMSLEAYADFQILSTGSELHGWFKFKGKAKEAPMERAEFQRALHALAPLLEVQFELPLNEMKPRELLGWRRSSALPLAMTGSALLVWLLNELVLSPDLIFQPASSKVWLGLSLFATGLGLFWGAVRVPPHYFLRTALGFILLFSWSSFLWIYGIFTALNPIVAPGSLSLQCKLTSDVQGVIFETHSCQLLDKGRMVQLPGHYLKPEWLTTSPQLEVTTRVGFFGQIFAEKVSLSGFQPVHTLVHEPDIREGAPPAAESEELTATTGRDVSREEGMAKPGSLDVDEQLDLDLGSEAGLPANSPEDL